MSTKSRQQSTRVKITNLTKDEREKLLAQKTSEKIEREKRAVLAEKVDLLSTFKKPILECSDEELTEAVKTLQAMRYLKASKGKKKTAFDLLISKIGLEEARKLLYSFGENPSVVSYDKETENISAEISTATSTADSNTSVDINNAAKTGTVH